ncbi:hypothetical protein [Photobacterium sp. TLY01]|uniref:hypothetical protein n=1 Tax=Photobacterium sp. TLY01 TaxID=2907534 RepID=UPI001F31F5A2|nr:hypothetical protein [Photobacterium sp. TLY01]UIP29593.1 hypothetical protein LN341_18650 [Photobacterium sp. TLY01]
MMRLLTLLPFLLVAACTSLPEPIPDAIPAQQQIYTQSQAGCVDLLTDFKRTVQQQGVQDAQLAWDPRFPHLAFDRFSLSWLFELTGRDSKRQWLDYVSHQAAVQRQAEYQNLPDNSAYAFNQLEQCAAQLVSQSLYQPALWSVLIAEPPQPVSGYSSWQRVLGLYPLTQHLARPSVDKEKRRLISHFIQPVEGDAIRYAPDDKSSLNRSQIQAWFRQARARSALSWPQLSAGQQQRLLNHYAPVIQVETRSRDDFPGQVKYVTASQPAVVSRKPTLYTHVSYTRFYGQTLMQLNYSLWFANRTARSGFDPYAGRFDGVLIRLTLDADGQPYILDSIHHCGCYHMVFALSPTLRFAATDNKEEWPVTLQVYAGQQTDKLGVTLSAGEHMVKDVQWLRHDVRTRSLTVLPYEQLRSLPAAPSQNKSLFNPQGMLPASVRAERFYLWPLGVKSPGTQRQLGHHATAFIGKRHFDEAFLFETFFKRPEERAGRQQRDGL